MTHILIQKQTYIQQQTGSYGSEIVEICTFGFMKYYQKMLLTWSLDDECEVYMCCCDYVSFGQMICASARYRNQLQTQVVFTLCCDNKRVRSIRQYGL